MCGGPHQWYTFSYVHVLEVCYYSQGFKTRISCGDAANPLIPFATASTHAKADDPWFSLCWPGFDVARLIAFVAGLIIGIPLITCSPPIIFC